MELQKPRMVYALDADKMKFRYTSKERSGGNGFGISSDGCMYTLNTIDHHMVAIVYGESKSTRVRKRQGVCEGR